MMTVRKIREEFDNLKDDLEKRLGVFVPQKVFETHFMKTYDFLDLAQKERTQLYYSNDFCYNAGISDKPCEVCYYSHWGCMMICSMCEKFSCDCVIKPQKQCLFCTYKTWKEYEKNTGTSPLAKVKWQSYSKTKLEGIDEVDHGDGDNATTFLDYPLKPKKKSDDSSDDDEIEFANACKLFTDV